MSLLAVVIYLVCMTSSSTANETRYVTYTVTYGEGFNLRRDVHTRAANLVLRLRQTTPIDWVLVLPPWPHLYHWKSPFDQAWLPWKQFFDVAELEKYVPCIEFEDYISREGHVIDEVSHMTSMA